MRNMEEVPVSMQAVTGLVIAITIFMMCDAFGIVSRETAGAYLAGIITLGVAGIVSAPIAWAVWQSIVFMFGKD